MPREFITQYNIKTTSGKFEDAFTGNDFNGNSTIKFGDKKIVIDINTTSGDCDIFKN